MITTTLTILSIIVITVLSARSCDKVDCFVKKLFDFTYPTQGLYQIQLNDNQTQMNSLIRAYGDFNNDLRADYVSIDGNNNTLVFIYSTTTNQYNLVSNISAFQGCNPLNYYLYDANGDGVLDITVWGNNGISNCLYLLIQNDSIFTPAVNNAEIFTMTTQPSLFEYYLSAGGGTIKTNCLLIYANSQRLIYYYSNSNNGYLNLPWSQLFTDTSTTNYTQVAFSNQHWNSFVDLTNDCYPDFIITNIQNIQFWIYNSNLKQFQLKSTQPINTPLTSLGIIDINYDGSLDLVIANFTVISIYMGTTPLTLTSQFCVSGSYNFGFNWGSPYYYDFDSGQILPQQNLQFADIDVNGYPQILGIVTIGTTPKAFVLKNQFETGNNFAVFSQYQDKINQFVYQNMTILTVSFFDLLDNGIVDIFLNVQNSSGVITEAIYNNFLYQNFFYIKGYGTNGKPSTKGTQVVGLSFYWLNSVGNSQRVAYLSQISQTAYNAYPMPYVLTGLGRANNYVQSFTMGRLGEEAAWSPIIPNSQLAIFSGAQASTWGIKIFIMPADSLVYVVIVCIVILTILGLVLVIIKCRKKKAQNIPLLADI